VTANEAYDAWEAKQLSLPVAKLGRAALSTAGSGTTTPAGNLARGTITDNFHCYSFAQQIDPLIAEGTADRVVVGVHPPADPRVTSPKVHERTLLS
jgi:hypothetical protein